MKNNFPKNLKHLRLQKKMTQEELGKALDKDYSTIGKWELGQRSPIMEDVIKIADYFNVSLSELIIKNLSTSNSSFKETFSQDDQQYKKILKDKGLMNENDQINENKIDDLLKIADMMKNFNSKKED